MTPREHTLTKILIINSSPRKQSNSRILAAKVAEGATRKGHSVKTIEIGRANIRPCMACGTCQKNPGKCIIKDDMAGFYCNLAEADILIFSSPIYFYSINGQMKVFLDRTYPLVPGIFRNKRIGGVFVYGDVDPVKSGCINAIRMFQDLDNGEHIGVKWIGAVYGSLREQGEAENAHELLNAAKKFGESLV